MSITDQHVRLAQELGSKLAARHWRLSAAESCTGGLVSAAITAVAGSSAWFERGFITYSNEAKCELLGVPPALIDAHGAVSEPVARAMAEGAMSRSRAECALSVTGIAGPSGGTPTKPVGTVCFGWQLQGSNALAVTRHLPGDRAAVRLASVDIALRGLIELIDGGALNGGRPD